MGEMRNIYKILGENPEGKRLLGRHYVDGRPLKGWYLKMCAVFN
jgi:hypothetical protein